MLQVRFKWDIFSSGFEVVFNLDGVDDPLFSKDVHPKDVCALVAAQLRNCLQNLL